MELQEEMFAMVAAWRSSGLTKKAFLADRPIGLPKFNYWCNKFNGLREDTTLPTLCNATDFHELLLKESSAEAPAKVFELTTPSGLRITVFE